MDHGATAQNRKIKRIAVEGYKLGLELLNTIDERGYQLLLGTLTTVRRANCVNHPPIVVAMSDQR
jgi:hypothetical protein